MFTRLRPITLWNVPLHCLPNTFVSMKCFCGCVLSARMRRGFHPTEGSKPPVLVRANHDSSERWDMQNLSVPFLCWEGWRKQGRAHTRSFTTSGSDRTRSQLRWGKERVPTNIHQKDAIWDTKVLSWVKREAHQAPADCKSTHLFVSPTIKLTFLSANFKGAEGKSWESATITWREGVRWLLVGAGCLLKGLLWKWTFRAC